MDYRYGQKWTREETLLAFDLYCRTPFGKIDANNSSIIELAALIGRSPSSVALKMSNLSHFDPTRRARNKVGMAHGSRLDEEVFSEYCQNLGDLKEEVDKIKEKLGVKRIKVVDLSEEDYIAGKTKEQVDNRRVRQMAFRVAVLNSYNNQCCVTGLNKTSLLVATPIKPWAISNPKTEQTNPKNGLCLNALHAMAFEKGLITIDTNHRLIESKYLWATDMDEETKSWLHYYDGKNICLPEKFEPAEEFLKYHNQHVFLDNLKKR